MRDILGNCPLWLKITFPTNTQTKDSFIEFLYMDEIAMNKILLNEPILAIKGVTVGRFNYCESVN